MSFLDPSTIHGALILGIIGGLISGAILGFFSGRTYERKAINKSKNKIKCNGNVNIQNSNFKG